MPYTKPLSPGPIDAESLRLTNADLERLAKRIPVAGRESVNHPAHYTWHPAGVEAVTICEAFNYNLGNAIAYIWRAGGTVTKGDVETDLKKAVWYIQRELERIIAQGKTNGD